MVFRRHTRPGPTPTFTLFRRRTFRSYLHKRNRSKCKVVERYTPRESFLSRIITMTTRSGLNLYKIALLLQLSCCLKPGWSIQLNDPVNPQGDQNPDFSGFDKILMSFLEDNGYTGATVGLVRNGRLVYTQGYGFASDDSHMLPTKQLHTSSISKSITAVAILKLVQEKRLDLDEAVFGDNGILSEIHLPKHLQITDPRILEVTVKNLLQHSGGWHHGNEPSYDAVLNRIHLSEEPNVSDDADDIGFHGELSQDNFIKDMIRQPLAFMPGTRYQYSNFGYIVLGRIIEAVTERKYDTYVAEEILAPLGMWQTQIGPVNEYDSDFKYITPSVKNLERRQKAFQFLDSALGWYSTVYDLLRFSTGISSILQPESIQEMLKHPFISEHANTWHGLGVHVNVHSAWWQTADPHDNELVMYNQALSSREGKHQLKTVDSYVIMLSQNNRKDVRKLMSHAISAVQEWSDDVDLFTSDCADSIHRVTDGAYVLMKYRLAERQIQAFGAALAHHKFYPVWVNGHTISGNTYFSVVYQQNVKNDDSIKVFYDLDNDEADEILNSLSSPKLGSLEIQYIGSYESQRHNGHIRYTVVVGRERSDVKQVQWHERVGKYQQRLADIKKRGLLPVLQTVRNHKGQNYVTALIKSTKVSNWKSYANIALSNLEGVIKQNAKLQRTLLSLDARMEEDGVKFSAIFSQQKYADWLVHIKLSEAQLNEEIYKLKALTYTPKIIVGYEIEGKPYYAAMWGKPGDR